MHLLTALSFAVLASAIAVPEPAHRAVNKRAEVTSSPIAIAGLPSDTNIVISVAVVTAAPDANAARVNEGEVDYESSSSACTPMSYCFDGITCGLRYGGCYDKNFCAGSTSFPIPSCTDTPATGLTQNFRKRMEEARAVEEAQ